MITLTTFDLTTFESIPLGEAHSVTVSTTGISFTLVEQEDGSIKLYIDGQLVVEPKASNVIVLKESK